jgi:hypothetical protein
MEETKEEYTVKGILQKSKIEDHGIQYSEDEVSSIDGNPAKPLFISPRLSASDDILFPVDQTLYDTEKRWECISKQAGVHRQDGSILTVNHRGLSPEAFECGMSRQASLRVRCLHLCLDHREEVLPEWIDVISEVLINLEHLSVFDARDDDIVISKRMERLFILYHIPNLKSIDDMLITPEERELIQSKLNERTKNGASLVEEIIDVDNEEGELPRVFSSESISSESFGDNTATEQGIEFNQELVQKVADIDLGHMLEHWDGNLLDKEDLQVVTENLAQNHNTNVTRQHKGPLQELNIMENVRNSRQLITPSKMEVASVASSHHEWTAACGVLAFRSDRGCMPHIRLFSGLGEQNEETSNKNNNSVREEAKRALRERNASNVRVEVCPSIPRQESISKHQIIKRSETKPNLPFATNNFFPIVHDAMEMPCGERVVVIQQEADKREEISKPLPLVRMRQRSVINGTHDNMLINSLGLKKTRATSVFDEILDEEEDFILAEGTDWNVEVRYQPPV